MTQLIDSLNEQTEIYEDAKSDQRAGNLISLLRKEKVRVPTEGSDEYNTIHTELAKVLDNVPTGVYSLIHSKKLAIFLKVLAQFSSFPILQKDYEKAIATSSFKLSKEADIFKVMNLSVSRNLVKRQGSNIALGSNGVADLLNFLVVLGIRKDRLKP